MKAPSGGTLSFAAVGVAAIVLAAVGVLHERRAPAPTLSLAADPPSVSANGFTLASTSVTLPDDDAQYPGPHADAINAQCTACHSASMVLSQPPLSADAWKAEVTKMREAYKAPVPDAAVPEILAYLSALSAQRTSASPAPPSPPRNGRPPA